MSQHDYAIANGSGAAIRTDLNNALGAIVTTNSGTSAPASTFAFQLWADTTADLLKIRNAANSAWITVGTLSAANLGLLSLAGGTMTGTLVAPDGAAATPSLRVGDEQNGLFSPSANNLAVSTGGVEGLRIDSSQRLLLGHTASVTATQVDIIGTTSAQLGLAQYSANNAGPGMHFSKSRSGSKGGVTVVQADDAIGSLTFYGTDGTDLAAGVKIVSEVDATPGSNDMPGRFRILTSQDGSESLTEAVRVDRNQCVGINNTNPSSSARLVVQESGARSGLVVTNITAAQHVANFLHGSNSQTGANLLLQSNTASGTGFFFLLCQADVDGTPDSEFILRGDGVSIQDGGTSWATPADYAEFFESSDGQPIPLGASVVLEGDKVRAATVNDPAESIIGVARPKDGHGSIVANAASIRWSKKFERDVYGGYVTENGKRKLNPDWNPLEPYVPRAERPEWSVVGLVGQVVLRKGAPVNPRWRKMRDVNANIEQWFIR